MELDDDDSLPYHIPAMFKVGARVKVTKDVAQAHAWHPAYNNAVARKPDGKILFVRLIDELKGFMCSERLGFEGYYFPSAALEEVSVEDVVIEVPSIQGW